MTQERVPLYLNPSEVCEKCKRPMLQLGPDGALWDASCGVCEADERAEGAEARAERLWKALDRARREGGYSPHHCPGCDAGTDETHYDDPAEHHPGCWLAEALAYK